MWSPGVRRNYGTILFIIIRIGALYTIFILYGTYLSESPEKFVPWQKHQATYNYLGNFASGQTQIGWVWDKKV